MAEETYFYREGERRELQKAPDVIGISFLSVVHTPVSCALTEPSVGSTQLRRLAYLQPPCFGVFRLDPATGARGPRLLERRDRAMEMLRAVGPTEFVSHAYRTDPAAETNVLVLTDEIVAKVTGLTVARLRTLLERRGLRYLRSIDIARRIFLLQVTARAGENALKAANRLVEDGVAAAAEPNFVRRLPYRRRPSDPHFGKQWHLDNPGRDGGVSGADVRALDAWSRTLGSRDVTIAIVDDGLDLRHEEFRKTGKLRKGYNFHDRNDDPSAPPTNRHGTACAGIAAALANNRKGGCGIAPGCGLLPVRTPDEWGEEVGYADAVAWAAEHGADVISCSWGPPDGYWSEDGLPLAMEAALERATTKGRDGLGAVITWAAGNGNEPADLDGFASDPRVIAVAASDDRDLKASYSDFGGAISVCAPGGDTFRGRPGIWTTDLSGKLGYSPGNYTPDFGGTSAAAPLVAGVAALVLSVNSSLRWSEVRSLLQETADKINPEGTFTDAHGETHPTRYEDGRSLCYGFGRVNAGVAVARAAALKDEARRPGPSVALTGEARRGRPAAAVRRKVSGGEPGNAGADPYFYRGGKKIPLRRVSAEVPRPRTGFPRPARPRLSGRSGRFSKSESVLSEAYVRPDADPSCLLVPTGQVVVQFAPEVDRQRVERELTERGAQVVRRLSYLANGYLVQAPAALGGALRLANELHEQPFVLAAEPNWIRRIRSR